MDDYDIAEQCIWSQYSASYVEAKRKKLSPLEANNKNMYRRKHMINLRKERVFNVDESFKSLLKKLSINY